MRARKNDRKDQSVLLPGPRDGGVKIYSYSRTVRDIHVWDGRTVGRVRHGGAEFVVQEHRVHQGLWEALISLSWSEVQPIALDKSPKLVTE